MSERIKLQQNTPEWLEYRFDHRNASEAGTVMQCNPFQSISKLRAIKESREDSFKGNPATEYGHRWEDAAKEKVEFLLGVDLEDAIFRDGVYSASLDAYGIDGNESVKVEIKCPYRKQDSKLWQQLQIDGDWTQVIPEYYVWQIVHQHMVCPTTRVYFFAFIPDEDFRLVECFVTDEQVERLRAAWEVFANPDTETTVNELLASQLVESRSYWKNIKSEAEKEIAQAEVELKRMAGEQNTDFPGGLSYVQRTRKGTVDTAKMQKDGIDVESYRKKATKYMTFVQE